MELRFTRAEYWLLETAVTYQVPLRSVNPDSYSDSGSIEEMFNKPGHGLDSTSLLQTFERLFRDGLIVASVSEQLLVPTSEQILSALSEKRSANPPCTCYGLTEKGGAAWEAFAAPDWSCFIQEELDEETETGEVTCMELWRVEKFLNFLNLVECEIDLKTICVKPVGQWEATYWKTLPCGHRAWFRWKRKFEPLSTNDVSDLVFSGFCNFRDNWYHWQ